MGKKQTNQPVGWYCLFVRKASVCNQQTNVVQIKGTTKARTNPLFSFFVYTSSNSIAEVLTKMS